MAIKDCVRADGSPAQTEFQVEHRFWRPAGAPACELARSEANPVRAGSETCAQFSLLRVLPRSGRKHQIRIHLAHVGHPIVGDKIYGGDEDLYLALVENRLTDENRARLLLPHHALHAVAIRFVWRGKPVEFRCEPGKWLTDFVAGC